MKKENQPTPSDLFQFNNEINKAMFVPPYSGYPPTLFPPFEGRPYKVIQTQLPPYDLWFATATKGKINNFDEQEILVDKYQVLYFKVLEQLPPFIIPNKNSDYPLYPIPTVVSAVGLHLHILGRQVDEVNMRWMAGFPLPSFFFYGLSKTLDAIDQAIQNQFGGVGYTIIENK